MDMEKIYLTMKRTGAGNIVLGILSICIGLAIVLLDIVMPVVDGFEVLAFMIKEHWNKIFNIPLFFYI